MPDMFSGDIRSSRSNIYLGQEPSALPLHCNGHSFRSCHRRDESATRSQPSSPRHSHTLHSQRHAFQRFSVFSFLSNVIRLVLSSEMTTENAALSSKYKSISFSVHSSVSHSFLSPTGLSYPFLLPRHRSDKSLAAGVEIVYVTVSLHLHSFHRVAASTTTNSTHGATPPHPPIHRPTRKLPPFAEKPLSPQSPQPPPSTAL